MITPFILASPTRGISNSPTTVEQLIKEINDNLVYSVSNNFEKIKNTLNGRTASEAWTDYSAASTIVGGDGTYDTKYISYQKSESGLVFVKFNLYILAAHSSGTAFTFTLPFASVSDGAGNVTNNPCQTIRNTTYAVGFSSVAVNSNIVTLYSAIDGSIWTNAQAKGAFGTLCYQSA
jgi:hypothetical protein